MLGHVDFCAHALLATDQLNVLDNVVDSYFKTFVAQHNLFWPMRF